MVGRWVFSMVAKKEFQMAGMTALLKGLETAEKKVVSMAGSSETLWVAASVVPKAVDLAVVKAGLKAVEKVGSLAAV